MRAYKVLLIAACLCLQAKAADTQSVVVGGPGGVVYSDRCARGEYLVGLAARSGFWLDAVGAVCAPWNVSGDRFGGAHSLPLRGGMGGQPGVVRCDAQSAIVELFAVDVVNRQRTVGLLAPRCASAVTLRQTQPDSRLVRFGSTPEERQADEDGVGTSAAPIYDDGAMPRCPSGSLAVGIFGGAGQYVDRIGLICEPRPISSANPMKVIVPKPERPIHQLGKRTPLSRSPAAVAETGGIAPAPSRTSASVGVEVSRAPPPQVAIGHDGASDRPCKAGFVWREARPSDHVCVTPQSRLEVWAENKRNPSRVDPRGAQGPATCVTGYVWREAFEGDAVCVVPLRRDEVWLENSLAASRLAE